MKVFIALGTLLILALTVLAVGPRFVNWNDYRAEFEAEASRILGEPVTVRGETSARLLPFPSVSFADVAIGPPDAPLLTVRDFGMDAELAPFLSGEVRIFDMRLDAPRLNLALEADGTVRWPGGGEGLAAARDVVLERIRISNGSAVFREARSGREFTLGDLDGVFSVRSLAGPVTGEGSFFAAGEPMGFTLTGGTLADGRLPVRVTARSLRAPLALSADLQLSGGRGLPLAEGRWSLSTLPPEDGEAPAAVLLPPGEVAGSLRLEGDTLRADDVTARIGVDEPYSASGRLLFDFGADPRFDLALRGDEVDLDALAPPPAEGTVRFADRVEAVRTALLRLPLPAIPGRVEVSLPVARVGDTPLRALEFAGSPTRDGWRVERLTAELPGRTQVQLSGEARLRGTPGFRGAVLVAVRQPAAFVAWAGFEAGPDLAALSRAGLSATADLSAGAQVLDDLELDLGGQTLRGRLERASGGEGTTTKVDLSAGDVDLDPFLALARRVLDGMGVRPDDERFEILFDAAPVRIDRYRIGRLGLDVALDRGTLDISNAMAEDFAGTDIHAEGTVANLFSAPEPDLGIDINSAGPERFVDFLGESRPTSPFLQSLRARAQRLGPLALTGTAAMRTEGSVPVLDVALEGEAAGTRVELALALENGLAAATLNGAYGLDLALANADPAVLLGQLGVPTAPLGVAGPLRFETSLSGRPAEPSTVSATLSGDGLLASANGTLSLGGDGLETVESRLVLDAQDATPWLTLVGVAAGQPVTGLPVDLAADLRWQDGAWSLTSLAGTVSDSRIAADLRREADGPVTGRVEASSASADWIETVLLGRTPASDAPFRAPLLPATPLALDVALAELEDGALPLRDLRATIRTDGAELALIGLEARTGEATLRGSGRLRNVEGLVTLRADVEATGLTASTEVFAGRADASFRLEGGGRTTDALRTSLIGEGRAALGDASLRGLVRDIAPLLADDAASPPVGENGDLAARLAELGDRAPLALPPLDLPFRIGAGRVTLEPFTVAVEGATLTGEASVDLADGALAGRLAVAPPVPTEDVEVDGPAPVLPYALAGTWRAPELVADPAPLAAFLSARRYAIEAARVRALEEDLRETVRLRREARLYRAREAERERLREEREAREEAEAAAREEERLRQEREAEETRRRAAEAARAAAPAPEALNFERVVPPPTPSAPEASPAAPAQAEGLPGVQLPF